MLTVKFASAGTSTTLPWIDNCPSPGSSQICINRFCGEIHLSSKGVKFKHCGLEQTSSFPLLRFDWQIEQIYFVLSIISLAVVVIHASSKVSEHLGYMFASHFLTDDRYHKWSQQVHTYSGPHLMLSWKVWMTFVIVCIFCVESWHLNSCISLTALQSGLLVAGWGRSWPHGFNPDIKALFLFCACLFSSLIWSGFNSLCLLN